MKTFMILAMLLALVTLSFGQQIAQKKDWKETDYYKTSRKQKTAAWVLTGAGTACLVVTFAIDMNEYATDYVLGPVDPESKRSSYTVPYVLGAACVVGGLYLFVASHINRNKAKATSVFIDMETAPVLQGTVFSKQSFPALGVRMRL